MAELSKRQWMLRWGCLAVTAAATLMQMVGMGAPYWLLEHGRPRGYLTFLKLLEREGNEPGANASLPGAITEAQVHVGLWRWCVNVRIFGVDHSACETMSLHDFPGWWRACQTMAVIGTLMGVVACVCAGMEVYYIRHGIGLRISGIAVLCALACFVAAVSVGLSHGLFATRYMGSLLSIIHLPASITGGGGSSTYPPTFDWAFGLGSAGGTIIAVMGIILVAFITRTYPGYQRAQHVVV